MLLECRVLIDPAPCSSEYRKPECFEFLFMGLSTASCFITKRYTKIDFAQQRKSHLLKVSMWPGTQGWPSLLSAMSLPQSSGHPWRREGLLSLVDTGCVWRHSWLSQPVGWHLRHHLGGGQGCCIYNPQRPGKPHNTGFS